MTGRSSGSTGSESDYSITGAHGTCAAITNQEHYDSRHNRHDDATKGRIDFPRRMYGREEEVRRLAAVWGGSCCVRTKDGVSGGRGTRVATCPRVVFVSGYSGVGKSALVRYFVRRTKEERRRSQEGDVLLLYACGKFNENSKCVPFSAFMELLEQLVCEIRHTSELEEWRGKFRTAVENSEDIGPNTEGGRVLRETWPMLRPLLDGTWKKEEEEEEGWCADPVVLRRERSQSLANSTATMNSVKEYTLALLSLLCSSMDDDHDDGNRQDKYLYSQDQQTINKPNFIFFLDDMQWADPPSLDMLSHLLSETTTLGNMMFICAYRSNEVHATHPLRRVIQDVTKVPNAKCSEIDNKMCSDDDNKMCNNQTNNTDIKYTNNNSMHHLELYPLSPSAIQQFVADTLLREDDLEDIQDLTHVIYQKTMGNIFFVMQAMEELVRKNALYYDVMCFSWTFADPTRCGRSGVGGDSRRKELLANYISEDVVQSVKGKIEQLSTELRRVLIVMAHIPHNALEVSTLRILLQETGMETTTDELVKVLNVGVQEGMLLLSSESGTHIFAHDRIRQASKECIEGKARDELLSQLANSLLKLYQDTEEGSQRDTEWCVFVAVDYLNSVDPKSQADALELAKLNLKVAKSAHEKGAIEKAYELLGNGIKCLTLANKLWEEYELTLEMYNCLIESECFLGLYDKAKLNVDEVLDRAMTLDDKLIAYRHRILCISSETRDYAKSLEEGIRVLNIYGFDFPSSPTVKDVVKEEMKVKLALLNRPYSCLLDRPTAKNPIMELFKNLTRFALLSGNDRLLRILCWRAIRLALTKGIDHHFHTILVTLGSSMAKVKSEIKVAFEIATVAVHLSEKHREDRGNYAYTQLVAYQGVLLQLQSFRSGIDVMLQCYKDLKLAGELDPALGSAMAHFLTIFAAGIPIGPLVESKLLLIEEFARKTENNSFATIFQMQRQFVLNLWKPSDNPTELKGDAFDEEEILAALNPTSKVYSMTLRDTSTYRLHLAFLFNDQITMRKMLDILRNYPMTDVSVPRFHLRLTFMGLSAFALLQTTRDKAIEDVAKSCLAHFSSLSKLGSVNATPVYHFLLAMKQPGIKSFELAIDSCAEASLPHLEAMAKERYGLYLCRQDNSSSIGQDYLVSAYWLYYNWGAHAKALEMWEEHACIKTASKDKANSRIGMASSVASVKSQKEKDQKLIEEKRKKGSLRKQLGFGRKSFRLKGKATTANLM